MPRGRPPRQPSGRNLQLYHELVCAGRSPKEVAARFRLSQARVAQLRRQVAQWVEDTLGLPASGGRQSAEDDPAARLHAALLLRRLQVQPAYEKYLNHFGGAGGALAYGRLLADLDAGLLPSEMVRLPPRTYITSAVRMARELEDLERLAPCQSQASGGRQPTEEARSQASGGRQPTEGNPPCDLRVIR